MIDINTFTNLITNYYFSIWLWGASAVMGVMLIIKKIIIRR